MMGNVLRQEKERILETEKQRSNRSLLPSSRCRSSWIDIFSCWYRPDDKMLLSQCWVSWSLQILYTFSSDQLEAISVLAAVFGGSLSVASLILVALSRKFSKRILRSS
mmetsp:Transcript_7157/g.11882  ORF Transcript_7157/g.11882 Transcript_7157/m.11882 type:complete len:108 (-) Transcript_7157:343-666(-)